MKAYIMIRVISGITCDQRVLFKMSWLGTSQLHCGYGHAQRVGCKDLVSLPVDL
jgi:hypothetical protein